MKLFISFVLFVFNILILNNPLVFQVNHHPYQHLSQLITLLHDNVAINTK